MTGWVGQPVEEVAIKEIGRPSTVDPFQAALDGFAKRAGNGRIDFESLL